MGAVAAPASVSEEEHSHQIDTATYCNMGGAEKPCQPLVTMRCPCVCIYIP